MAFAVTVVLATPAELVVTDAAENVALAPVVGAVKVTVLLGTGLPEESMTTATSCWPKVVPARVSCGVPLTARMAEDVPVVFCSENDAVLLVPAPFAVTV